MRLEVETHLLAGPGKDHAAEPDQIARVVHALKRFLVTERTVVVHGVGIEMQIAARQVIHVDPVGERYLDQQAVHRARRLTLHGHGLQLADLLPLYVHGEKRQSHFDWVGAVLQAVCPSLDLGLQFGGVVPAPEAAQPQQYDEGGSDGDQDSASSRHSCIPGSM